MNSITGAITSYQAINNFVALRVGRTQNDNLQSVGSNSAPADDKAAYASISSEAIALYNTEQQSNSDFQTNSGNSDDELTQQEKQEVAELQMTDAQVRAHEQAHKAAAGGLRTSSPNYEYETGPDGEKYAVAGDVNVSYQHSQDPEVNLRNAQQLKASALAPADPSAQDRKVAAQADREIAQARQEILEEQKQTDEEDNNSNVDANADLEKLEAFLNILFYESYLKIDSKKSVDTYSAKPGHSEHQSGLAIDINITNDSFIDTKEAKWLNDNAYKYGFILRYPRNKSDITGYKYEPWHYRYVGCDLAKKLYNNGDWETIEEYFEI